MLNPSDAAIREMLQRERRLAVVGFSKSPRKDAHTIPIFMRDRGWEVIPVNPSADEIAGMRSYPTLKDVPDAYDIVVLFRPSAKVPPFVDDAIEDGRGKVIWMQLGIRNEPAAEKARAAGWTVVQDRCLRVEVVRLGL